MTDVLLTPAKRISTAKGDVLHGIKISDLGFAGFGEAYFSYVHHNSIKAWKLHKKYTVNFLLPLGKVKIVLCKSTIRGEPLVESIKEIVLSEDSAEYQRLTIPPHTWYGFQGLAKPTSLIFSFLNGEHDENEKQATTIEEFPYDWNIKK